MKIYSVQLCLKHFADQISLFKNKEDSIKFINDLYKDGIPSEKLKLKEFEFFDFLSQATETEIKLPF